MAANASHIFGFRPVRTIDSNDFNAQTELHAFSASDATATFKGDLVIFDSTNRSSSLTDAYAPGIPLITQAGSTLTTTVYRGVCTGFVPQPEYNMTATASLGTQYRLASTARYAWVIVDVNVIFEVQESGTNSYTSSSSNGINKLIDVSAGSGNTTTGISQYTVVGSTVATTNKPFRILRATQRVDNFVSAASPTQTTPNWHWDVQMANQDYMVALVGA